jgi:DeoR/GlpR family transcriptional regulator of sugar metabolism
MNQRCFTILDLLNHEATLNVNGLADRLSVSSVTIRKDIAILESKGLLRRRHGSVMLVPSSDTAYRMSFDYEVKLRIARRAADMVHSGEAVMIESGSTCALLAEELVRKKRDVTIITNSAFIAGHVRAIPGARIVLLGGVYDPDAQVMSGPLVGKCAAEFFVDRFFLGTYGYDANLGFSIVDMLRAEAARAMAARAEERIVLADETKFSKRGVVQLLPVNEVTSVITNAIPDHCRASLESSGVGIILA